MTAARSRAKATEVSGVSRASIAFGTGRRSMQHRRSSGLVCSVLAATLLGVAALPLDASQRVETSNAQPAFDLQFNRQTGELTGRLAAGSDIASVIRRIGDLARFESRLQPGLGVLTSPMDLDGLKAEVALRRLIRRNSIVMVRGGPGRDRSEITKIWVIVAGEPVEPVTPSPTPARDRRADASEREYDSEHIARAASVREIVKLANKADGESISELRDLATGAEDAALRRAAMSALAGIAGAESFALFAHSGLLDPDATVRIEAARSLIRVDRLVGSDIVEAAAQRDPDPIASEIMERLARGETVERVGGLPRARLEH